jgi:NAD(P)-dependent dehydrogenase (short-subunit alcohol dehydrogenase family)
LSIKLIFYEKEIVFMRLKDKVAIITGAGSGQGKAAARLFAKEGAAVIIAEWNEENGKQVEEEITSAGGQALFIQTDISSRICSKTMIHR